MTDVVLPDLGEGLVEAEIVEWRVAVGDPVVSGQPLVAVETDKSVVEVPAPSAGTVVARHGAPGDLVAVGGPLVTLDTGERPDAGSVVGRVAPPPAGGGASPAARVLARRLGVDLTAVAGSGPGGAVTTDDVRAVAGAAPGTGGHVVELRGVRRAMATNMARAGRDVVPATVHDVADVADWVPGQDPTLRLLRAVGAAARAEPALNVTFPGPGHGLERHEAVHVAVAVETDDGLFTPVLRDVTDRDAAGLRDELERLRSEVARRSVPPEDLAGGTITLSNYGMHGGLHAELVVVPPQVAIVGAGRLHDAVVALDGRPAVRATLPLSLTFDHRVVTGVEAIRFLTALIDDLRAPE